MTLGVPNAWKTEFRLDLNLQVLGSVSVSQSPALSAALMQARASLSSLQNVVRGTGLLRGWETLRGADADPSEPAGRALRAVTEQASSQRHHWICSNPERETQLLMGCPAWKSQSTGKTILQEALSFPLSAMPALTPCHSDHMGHSP